MRKTQFANGEYYHIYNRGVDKRTIFSHRNDISRFLQSMEEFNTEDPIGSIYENLFKKRKNSRDKHKHQHKLGASKLVEFVCYCLNPNHFHFLLKQERDKGIERFMHRLSTGYTKYFNQKYKRSSALFQGSYKAVHVDSNEYLLYISAYVNLNDRVHNFRKKTLESAQPQTSYMDYVSPKTRGSSSALCCPDVIMNQFSKPTDYRRYAEEALIVMRENRQMRKEIEPLLLEL